MRQTYATLLVILTGVLIVALAFAFALAKAP